MSTAAHEAVYASVAKPWLKYYDASFIGQPLPDCTTFEYLYQQNKQHLNERNVRAAGYRNGKDRTSPHCWKEKMTEKKYWTCSCRIWKRQRLICRKPLGRKIMRG